MKNEERRIKSEEVGRKVKAKVERLEV